MTRDKLGLALAGGGFRASLFHLGVLRRMAELDLLRYVQILSTVSGGSIVGALYILLLKRRLEDPKYKSDGPDKLHIDKSEYEIIVNELQTALVDGIRKNLRTRLLMNPWTLIKVILWKRSLTAEMGRLYEKHIFASAVAELQKLDPQSRVVDCSGRIPLTAIRLRKEQAIKSGGMEQYNADALNTAKDDERGGKPGSAATRLILNATSLNSGARFWFSHTEVGDWYLGHVRRDEIETELLPRKIFRDLPSDERLEFINTWPNEAERRKYWHKVVKLYIKRYGKNWTSDFTEPLMMWGECSGHRVKIEFVHWLAVIVDRERAVSAAPRHCFKRSKGPQHETQWEKSEVPLPWNGPLDASEFLTLIRALLHADAGRLRNAKNYAWYLSQGRTRSHPVTVGMDDKTLWMLFWDALESIDEMHAQRLKGEFNPGAEPDWCKQLLESVLEVYYCQTAAVISPRIRDEWDGLPLADAVAASAAFPPVFPPYQLDNLYDDMHVQVLSLTDGGPFDNIGVTALLDEHCNYVIASDTGAVFNTRQSKATVGFFGLVWRLFNLLLNRPAQLYRHDLNERRRLGRAVAADCSVSSAISQFAASRELRCLASFRIGSPRLTNDSPPLVDPRLISRLRTDLDIFGDVEIKCLVNEGYVIADQYLRERLKRSPFKNSSWGPPERLPFRINLENDRVERILKVGEHRLFRALMLWAPLSTLVTLGAATGLVSAVWINGWEWPKLYAALNTFIHWVVTKLLTWDWMSVLIQSISLRYALTLVLLLPFIWWFIKNCLEPWASLLVLKIGHEFSGKWRWVLWIWKTAKGLKGNLLWILFKLLPVAVLVVVPIAWASHFLFDKPFQWKTRDPEGLDRPKA